MSNVGIPTPRISLSYPVTLACRSRITGRHHKLEFSSAPPFFGDEIYCLSCREMSRVIIAPHEGRARCMGDGSEPCGYDTRGHWGIGNARSRARHHALRYPEHRLALYLGARRVAVVSALTWEDALSEEISA